MGKKKIILLGDDFRGHSGIANVSRNIVLNTAHKYDWFQIGRQNDHTTSHFQNALYDLSNVVNKEKKIKDANVKILSLKKNYGDWNTLSKVIEREKPDALFLFNDPHFWTWVFRKELEIRTKIPIIYLNIWDNLPMPTFNTDYYKSCDGLLAISRLTESINKELVGTDLNKVIKYTPHGVDTELFTPVPENDIYFKSFRNKLFRDETYDFVVLFNSVNTPRKRPQAVIESFIEFCRLTKEKCLLVLNTQPVDKDGGDLRHYINFASKDNNIVFFSKGVPERELNFLYNASDVLVAPSYAEGWGLTVTEAVSAGTMAIATKTGGLQDQMGLSEIRDPQGEWIVPLKPSVSNLSISNGCKWIYEDFVSTEKIVKALQYVHKLSKEQRREKALKGRAYFEKNKMTLKGMVENIEAGIDETFEKFRPRKHYDFVKI